MKRTESLNGVSKNLKMDEIPIEELENQHNALAALIEERKEIQRRAREKPTSSMPTNTVGRLKSLSWVVFLLLAAGFLYNYIVINDLSMRPIDIAGFQKVLLSVIVFFSALLLVEKALRYFVPYLHQYFVNDRASEQDFSTHLQQLQPWQLICVTCFFIGLFFWGFVMVLTVKW
ncbi:hypothetical protein [Runella sp.]|uniref:hypothetical protein n=1 Tax=Runella sp. TaxID=1960881 RepID=UPI0026296177|nr:hypothetical protein [Runella sp.]